MIMLSKMVSDPYFFWCEYKYRTVTLRGSRAMDCVRIELACSRYGVAVARGPYPWSSREDMATDLGPLRHHTGPCR